MLVRERREYTGLTPYHCTFKNPLWVGAGTEMRTQYLPDHLSDDIATAPSGPVDRVNFRDVLYYCTAGVFY